MNQLKSSTKLVLVTGGSGYIGCTLMRDLLAAGYKVRLLDNLMYGGRSIIGIYNHYNFEYRFCDVRDYHLVNDMLDGVDYVVHLAAIVGDVPCQKNPDDSIAINRESTKEIYRLSQKRGVKKFVFASTCSNYGILDSSQIAIEESPLNPISLYAETKVDAEEYILKHNDGKMTAVCFRFGTAYGISARTRFDLLVNSFTFEAIKKKKIIVYAADTWRPYIHVADICDILLRSLIMPDEKINNQIFNGGYTAENYIKQDVARMIAEIIEGTEIVEYTDIDDLRSYRVSFDKLESIFNFEPRRKVRDGVIEIKNVFEYGLLTEKDYNDTKL